MAVLTAGEICIQSRTLNDLDTNKICANQQPLGGLFVEFVEIKRLYLALVVLSQPHQLTQMIWHLQPS